MRPVHWRPLAALTAILAASLAWSAITMGHGDMPGSGGGGHGDHGGHSAGPPVPAPDADRCDLGFNTKAYNDLVRQRKTGSMSPSWAQTFLRHDTRRLLTYSREQLGTYWFNFNVSKHMYDGMVKPPSPHLHPLTDHWTSLTDPVVCDRLKQQLLATRAFAARYPTLRDATADGFTFVTPFFAGAGTHMGRWEDLDDKVDPARPEVLIYDGNDPGAKLVGVMYTVLADQQPRNVFVGGNDVWHQHRGLCFTTSERARKVFSPMERLVIGSERAENIWCERMWGGQREDFASLWMMHVWVVPGCENPWGLFAHDHPYLTVANSAERTSDPRWDGCKTGTPPTGANRMETDELNIPGRLSTYRSSRLTWREGDRTVASGPVAALLDDHPGANHTGGEEHLYGRLSPEGDFTGPNGDWIASIFRRDNVIRGWVQAPDGTKAEFATADARRTDCGVALTAGATTPAGAAVTLELELCNPGLRATLLDPQVRATESLRIEHPAHGHDHANGPVRFDLADHPGEAHGEHEDHLFGTATTLDGFEGDQGTWTVSLVKDRQTKRITGYLKNPAGSKTFTFVVDHHDTVNCDGGVELHASGSEAATPTDPQNPIMVICDPRVEAFFADHAHGTPTPTPEPEPGPPADPGDPPGAGVVTERHAVQGVANVNTIARGTLPLRGVLETQRDTETGAVSGTLRLQPQRTSLDAIVMRVAATVSLGEVAVTGGTLGGTLTLDGEFGMRLSDIKLAGLPIRTGADCGSRATQPLRVSGAFSPRTGGTLTGKVTLGELTGCGTWTKLLSFGTAGDGSSVTLTIGPRQEG